MALEFVYCDLNFVMMGWTRDTRAQSCSCGTEGINCNRIHERPFAFYLFFISSILPSIKTGIVSPPSIL